ncbi:MAG: molybdopterin-dependent oxidoreductase, partial [Nitrospina sp.]|nr:molybdopterin-dependent oxidoreductase [Nitrospina sp.]
MNNNPALSPEDIRMGKIPLKGSGIEVRKTICDICNPQSHCGIDAYVKDGVVIKVAGTKENPHSGGTLCSKGAASRQYIYNEDRIRTPLMRKGERGSEDFEPISWDQAFDIISSRLMQIKDETGPESVLFYAGYPKWMRPFLKRLAHSFGSPNYLSESSCCSAAQKLAQRLNYGVGTSPQPPKAKCLMVWSKNPFYSNTAVARKLMGVIEKGVKIIEVGPLMTPFSKHAEVHLRLRPGTSGALALGMANVIINEGLYDRDFVEKWTEGFDAYRAYVMAFSPSKAAEITGVSADLIEKAARLYATSKPAGLLTG